MLVCYLMLNFMTAATLLIRTKVTLLSTTRKLIYLNKEFAAL